MKPVLFEVHDELFQGWVKETKHNFVLMIETMMKVAEVVKEETLERTPVRTGKLSRSFRETIITDNSRMKVVEIQMSALNERTGYDYAMTQHRGYHTSKNGWKAYYHRKGTELGFVTYQPKIWGKGYETSVTNYKAWEVHRGESKYMYWGIRYAETSAFEIIETDYLSMFMGGFIV